MRFLCRWDCSCLLGRVFRVSIGLCLLLGRGYLGWGEYDGGGMWWDITNMVIGASLFSAASRHFRSMPTPCMRPALLELMRFPDVVLAVWMPPLW